MGSKTKKMRDQEEKIKSHIVDRYRAGMCDHNGGFIPREKRGMAGKGSHFRPRAGPYIPRNKRRTTGE